MSVLYKCHFAEKLWYKNAKYAQLLFKMVKEDNKLSESSIFSCRQNSKEIFSSSKHELDKNI